MTGRIFARYAELHQGAPELMRLRAGGTRRSRTTSFGPERFREFLPLVCAEPVKSDIGVRTARSRDAQLLQHSRDADRRAARLWENLLRVLHVPALKVAS